MSQVRPVAARAPRTHSGVHQRVPVGGRVPDAVWRCAGDGFIEWREFAAHINDLRSKVRAFRAYVRTLG